MGEGSAALVGVCGVQGRTMSRNEAFPSHGTIVHGLCLEEKNLYSLSPKVHQYQCS